MLHFPHFLLISAIVGFCVLFMGHYFYFVGSIYSMKAEKTASWLDVAPMLGLRR